MQNARHVKPLFYQHTIIILYSDLKRILMLKCIQFFYKQYNSVIICLRNNRRKELRLEVVDRKKK